MNEGRPINLRERVTLRVRGPSFWTRLGKWWVEKEMRVQIAISNDAKEALVGIAITTAVAVVAGMAVRGCTAYEVADRNYLINRTNKFSEGNYCEGSAPGVSGTVWVECDMLRKEPAK
jgi:hypothetical protein